LIGQMKGMFTMEALCAVFGVSRSGYYAWEVRPVPKREVEEIKRIKPAIRKAFHDSRQTYGCVRISEILKRSGIVISARKARKVMQQEGLVPKARRHFRVTTKRDQKNKKCPDLVNRDFKIEMPHRLWTSDFTAIETKEGWLYMAVFMDVCTRMIVGWEASERMDEGVLIRAFNDAVLKRIPLPSAIVHSDQGGQYFGKLFKRILGFYDIRQSMGSTGDCFDNAITESLWNTIKTECFTDYVPETRKEAKSIIFDYVETFYNRERLHSSLGYVSPEEFEMSR
jgi:putative transposase